MKLSTKIIDITMEQIKSPLTSFPIWQMGSAISQVDEDETPFGGRKAGFTYNIGCCRETAKASRRNATALGAFGQLSSRGIRLCT